MRSRFVSAPPQADGALITDRQQLVEWFVSGSKPREDWRIGTEHEKFVFTRQDLRPAPYEGKASIRSILEGLAVRFGWTPVEIGRASCRGGGEVAGGAGAWSR